MNIGDAVPVGENFFDSRLAPWREVDMERFNEQINKQPSHKLGTLFLHFYTIVQTPHETVNTEPLNEKLISVELLLEEKTSEAMVEKLKSIGQMARRAYTWKKRFSKSNTFTRFFAQIVYIMRSARFIYKAFGVQKELKRGAQRA